MYSESKTLALQAETDVEVEFYGMTPVVYPVVVANPYDKNFDDIYNDLVKTHKYIKDGYTFQNSFENGEVKLKKEYDKRFGLAQETANKIIDLTEEVKSLQKKGYEPGQMVLDKLNNLLELNLKQTKGYQKLVPSLLKQANKSLERVSDFEKTIHGYTEWKDFLLKAMTNEGAIEGTSWLVDSTKDFETFINSPLGQTILYNALLDNGWINLSMKGKLKHPDDNTIIIKGIQQNYYALRKY